MLCVLFECEYFFVEFFLVDCFCPTLEINIFGLSFFGFSPSPSSDIILLIESILNSANEESTKSDFYWLF